MLNLRRVGRAKDHNMVRHSIVPVFCIGCLLTGASGCSPELIQPTAADMAAGMDLSPPDLVNPLSDEHHDGILDTDEGRAVGRDTDGDGKPDYLDLDSDGDGLLDPTEGKG